MVSTNPGIEVIEDEQRILRWNFADGSTKVVIEPILQFCGYWPKESTQSLSADLGSLVS